MTSCYLCHNDDFELITEKIRYDAPKRAYRCRKCGLVFLSPGMTPEEERTFYEQEYGIIFSSEKGTTPDKLFQARLPDAKMYFEWIKNSVGKDAHCLEIGCASGYFLSVLRDNVAGVWGVETHNLLRDYCNTQGIRAFSSLDECRNHRFDAVFTFFLLEHIGNPVEFLHEIESVMKPGGKIFIVVPNVCDALLSLYDIPAFQSFYFTPAHQFYYSKETLTRVLEKAGLEEIAVFPKQRYDLSNHMHWMMFGKPGGAGKYNAVFSEKLLREYAKNLEDHFLCDTLFAIATKKT